MSAALTIVDESPSGETLCEFTLVLVGETVTARELVTERVRHEVAAFNDRQGGHVFQGLVQPSDTERVLNGYRLKTRRAIDADEQVARALEAFERNGFFMLAGDHQVESLDEEIALGSGLRVSFVKLLPLVGG